MCCQADEADLRAFETASAAARSQGLFFRSLYQPELGEDEQQDAAAVPARRKPLADPAAAHAAAAVVTSSAEEEVSSPFRMYLFGYMAAVLALVVAQGEECSSKLGVVYQTSCLEPRATGPAARAGQHCHCRLPATVPYHPPVVARLPNRQSGADRCCTSSSCRAQPATNYLCAHRPAQ